VELAVEVFAGKAGPEVAHHHPVRIEHGNHIEYMRLSEGMSSGLTGKQVSDQSLNYE